MWLSTTWYRDNGSQEAAISLNESQAWRKGWCLVPVVRRGGIYFLKRDFTQFWQLVRPSCRRDQSWENKRWWAGPHLAQNCSAMHFFCHLFKPPVRTQKMDLGRYHWTSLFVLLSNMATLNKLSLFSLLFLPNRHTGDKWLSLAYQDCQGPSLTLTTQGMFWMSHSPSLKRGVLDYCWGMAVTSSVSVRWWAAESSYRST